MRRHHKLAIFIATFIPMFSYAGTGHIGLGLDITPSGYMPPKAKEVIVTSVEKGSAAEKAGIHVGDEIKSINNCVIPECSLEEFAQESHILSGSKVKINIVTNTGKREKIELIGA